MEQVKSGDPTEQADFIDLLRILWKWKWIPIACLVLSQAFLFAKAKMGPKRYEVTSKFIFKESGGDNNLSSLAAMVGLARGGGKSSELANFFDVILFTDEFLAQVLDRRWKVGGDSLTLAELWKMEPEPEGPDREYRRFRKMVGRIIGDDYITVIKRDGIVNLTTRFEDPGLAYGINGYLIEKLDDYLLNNTQSQARENRKFIDTRLVEVAAELRRSEDNLLAFNLRNQNPGSPALLLEMARLRRTVEVNQEIYLQLKKQLEMAKIDERKESPLIEVLSKPRYPLSPESPVNAKQRLIFTLAGAVLGVILALLIHFVREGILARRIPPARAAGPGSLVKSGASA